MTSLERPIMRDDGDRFDLVTAVGCAILTAAAALVAGCGSSGVTLLKPSNLVNYQYVTCFPHQDDPSALNECVRYYEERGFVKQDEVNLLQM